jgi:hypothetical protein
VKLVRNCVRAGDGKLPRAAFSSGGSRMVRPVAQKPVWRKINQKKRSSSQTIFKLRGHVFDSENYSSYECNCCLTNKSHLRAPVQAAFPFLGADRDDADILGIYAPRDTKSMTNNTGCCMVYLGVNFLQVVRKNRCFCLFAGENLRPKRFTALIFIL